MLSSRLKLQASTHNTQHDDHFRSADFLDVEHFPYITFKSKGVIIKDSYHGQLVGDLTIRGVTKEVVLQGEYSGVNQTPFNTYSAGFKLSGKINRKDWELNWNMVLAGDGFIASDEINMVINLEISKPVEADAAVQAETASA